MLSNLLPAIVALALQATPAIARPALPLEPSIVTKVAISSGKPFEMAIPTSFALTPNVMAREWEWTASAPVVSPVASLWAPSPQISWAPSSVLQETWVESISNPVWTPAPTPHATSAQTVTQIVSVTATQTSPPTSTPSYTYAETHDDSANTLTHEIIAATLAGLFVGVPVLGCAFFCMFRLCRRKDKVKKADIEVGSIATTGAADNWSLERRVASPRSSVDGQNSVRFERVGDMTRVGEVPRL
jgi:heme/copper-type cytochrome/quinol oxidase subunit 2